jgi:hypothetical protein
VDLGLTEAVDIRPGGQRALDVAPDGIVLDDHFLAAVTSISDIPGIDTAGFWRPYTVMAGFLSTGRDVTFTLAADVDLAALPADVMAGTPVTSLVVEIAGNDRVELIDATPVVTRVRSDAIAGLLPGEQTTADRFFYRVIRRHGDKDGASGAWREATGDRVTVRPD